VEAGHNANIIMGVGEDESLGDAIAVTIIATGFDIEQQNEIVNTEPKKIIHTLEDEQRSVHNLTNRTVAAFDLNMESPSTNSNERVVFDLLEDSATIPEPVLTAPTAHNEELMIVSEFVKNLDVTFEIVAPITDVDFTISSPVAEVKAVQPKVQERQEQTTFSFDLPLFKTEPVVQVEDNKVSFELNNETRDIKVNEAVQFVPVTELTDNGIIKYSLEEFMEDEPDFLAKPVAKIQEVVIPAELNITMKQVEKTAQVPVDFEAISPTEMTIEESLRMRSDERRKKLKEFNYKFHNNVSKIDEYEKEPAYKRLGIDISNNQANNTNSRISVGTDSNNDLQLRSNNSYLHDNVD
jgi:cell division protein FtsZ